LLLRARSGRQQLTLRAAGEAGRVHASEHLERGAEVLAGIQAAPLGAQPFPVQEVRAGKVQAQAGALEPLITAGAYGDCDSATRLRCPQPKDRQCC
jgi:hypothetical protein